MDNQFAQDYPQTIDVILVGVGRDEQIHFVCVVVRSDVLYECRTGVAETPVDDDDDLPRRVRQQVTEANRDGVAARFAPAYRQEIDLKSHWSSGANLRVGRSPAGSGIL
jgi:hypothetical protein